MSITALQSLKGYYDEGKSPAMIWCTPDEFREFLDSPDFQPGLPPSLEAARDHLLLAGMYRKTVVLVAKPNVQLSSKKGEANAEAKSPIPG